MSKLYLNDTTTLATFEDFILTFYVIMDDLHCYYAPPEVFKKWHSQDAKRSNLEIIFIYLCGKLVLDDSENSWLSP